jgi:NADP-dependent 3-hydroxy acid dehydrogenase YdfG
VVRAKRRSNRDDSKETEMDGSARPLGVITGASSGIGFEPVKIFREEAYDHTGEEN